MVTHTNMNEGHSVAQMVVMGSSLLPSHVIGADSKQIIHIQSLLRNTSVFVKDTGQCNCSNTSSVLESSI